MTETLGYATAVDTYRELGWTDVLPLRRSAKKYPPKGFTGHDGATPTDADIATWRARDDYRDGNICLRLPDTPDTIVGIDVDAYLKKTGGQTFTEAQARWGKLPLGYRISARPDPVPGIRLLRVPPGTRLRDAIEFPELRIGDVDIIQHHHRYVVVWPSLHPSGVMYRWWAEIDNSPLDAPPRPDDLPDLPERWLQALAEPVRNHAEHRGGAPYDIAQALTAGEPTGRLAARLTSSLQVLRGAL